MAGPTTIMTLPGAALILERGNKNALYREALEFVSDFVDKAKGKKHVKFRIPISECSACQYLSELYDACEPTDRQYWLMTELFVKLHGGKDTCEVIAP